MRASLVVVWFLSACVPTTPGRAPGTARALQIALSWNPRGDSFAYEMSVVGQAERSIEYVERDPEGAWIFGGPQTFTSFPAPKADPSAETVFPTVLGTRSSSRRLSDPVIERQDVREQARVVGVEGHVATVRFSSRTVSRRPAGLGIWVSEQQGEARFDLAAGHYLESRVRWLTNLEATAEREVVYRFEARETRRRRAELARCRTADRLAREQLDVYLRAHGPDTELAILRQALARLGPDAELTASDEALLAFHWQAHPADLMRMALASPPPGRRAILWALLADPSLAALEVLPRDAGLATSVRTAIESDPDLAAAARPAALGGAAVTAPSLEELRAHLDDPTVLGPLLDRFFDAAPEPAAVVPLLIDLLERLGPPPPPRSPGRPVSAVVPRPETTETLRVRCLAALQWLTFHVLGDDPAPWRALWERHAFFTRTDWALAGTAPSVPLFLRRHAFFELLAARPATAALDRVAAALGDLEPVVRLEAARVLARWGDRRAIPVLVRLLRARDDGLRGPAFEALGTLNDTTFGFVPQGEPVAQASALARWEEWARRQRP